MRRLSASLCLLLTCACGRIGFDPLVDAGDGPFAIDYGRRWAVLPLDREMPPLSPNLVGEAGSFSISPPLPDGLALDPESGVISGTTPATAGTSTHSISAHGTVRTATVELVLDLRPAIDVDSEADTDDAELGDGVCDTGTGECSLRAAIGEANASGQPMVVVVPPGTYSVGVEIRIVAEVAVVGSGAGVTILDGQLATRVLKSIDGGIAHVSDLEIRRGAATGGSAMEVFEASAFLSNVVVSQNILGNDGGGGIKYTGGSEGAIEFSTFSDNVADGHGGGLNVTGGVVDVYRTRFENNSSTDRGGALGVFGIDSTVTVEGCHFEGNHTDITGGALSSTYSATLVVRSSTFVDNTATTSGSVANTSFETPTIELVHCTMTGNDTVAAITGGVGSTTLTNSILATGTAEPCGGDTVISGGGNLAAMDATSCGLSSDDITGVDPLLGPDGSPASGSPVVDALAAGLCAVGSVDSRGVPRPLDGDGDGEAGCDIGAVEILPLEMASGV